MKEKNKIIFSFFLTISSVFILNYFFYNVFILLLITFIFIATIFYFYQGKEVFWRLGKFWFKFAIFLIFVFFIFSIFRCNSFENFKCILARTKLGINTALLLLNTVFILELFILSITINDILSIKVNIRFLKFLILTRTLFTQGITKFKNEKILFDIIPNFQIKMKPTFSNLKPIFFQNIIYILTITFYILEQAKILGPLIDNRIKHLYKKDR